MKMYFDKNLILNYLLFNLSKSRLEHLFPLNLFYSKLEINRYVVGDS